LLQDSLRATAATRLYKAGVDEQLVMERTGHRSLEVKKACTSDNQVLVPLPEQENPASENPVCCKQGYPVNQK